MSNKPFLDNTITSYVMQWIIGFGLLYFWIKDDPDKQWYWWVALSIFGTGLILMKLVVKKTNNAANAISEKLMEKLSPEDHSNEDKSP